MKDWKLILVIETCMFRHDFADILNPLCSCFLETEDTVHFFLRCWNYTNIRKTLINKLNNIDNSITSRQPNELLRIILHDDCKFKGYSQGTDFLSL